MMKILKIILLLLTVNNYVIAQMSLSVLVAKSPQCHDSKDGSITINVNGGIAPYFFKWNTGENIPILDKLPAGFYEITVTDSNNPKESKTQKIELINPKPIEIKYSIHCARTVHEDGPWQHIDSFKNINFPFWMYYKKIDSQYPFLKFDSIYQENSQKMHTIGYRLINPDTEEMYKFLYKITDAKGCTFETYLGLPYTTKILKVGLMPDTIKIALNELIKGTLKAAINIHLDSLTKLEWNHDNTPISCNNCINIDVNKAGKYQLSVSDRYGCEFQKVAYVLITDKIKADTLHNIKDTTLINSLETTAYLPTAFSPNDDGINDYFTAFSGGEVTKVLSMEVYDRWGGLVFQNSDFEPNVEAYGWNGKQRGTDAPQGNYTYTFRLLLKDGSEKTTKGEVMLMR